jgi:hypothetical protein
VSQPAMHTGITVTHDSFKPIRSMRADFCCFLVPGSFACALAGAATSAPDRWLVSSVLVIDMANHP